MGVALCNILDASNDLRHFGTVLKTKAFGLQVWPEGKRVIGSLK